MSARSSLALRALRTLVSIALVLGSAQAAQAQTRGAGDQGGVKASGGPGLNSIDPGGDCSTIPTYTDPVAPDHYAVSPGGVDMRSGTLKYSHTDLLIGNDTGEPFKLERSLDYGYNAYLRRMGDFFSHNWDVRLVEKRVKVCEATEVSQYDYQMTVAYGGLGMIFRAIYYDPVFTQLSYAGYGILTYTGAHENYTFTAKDGTTIIFRPFRPLSSGNDCTTAGRCTYASSVRQPDGTIYTLDYDTIDATAMDASRLRSVTSNRGYALLFEYNASDQHLITKSCIISLTVNQKPTVFTSTICPTGVPTASYGYAVSGTYQVQTSATDAGGAAFSFSRSVSGTTSTLKLYEPGNSSPVSTSVISPVSGTINGFQVTADAVTSQTLADGQIYSYQWDMMGTTASGNVAGGSFTDANNKTVQVRYKQYKNGSTAPYTPLITPGPEKVIDALGRETDATYCGGASSGDVCYSSGLLSKTDPGGIAESYTYDYYKNITELRRTAVAGSGLADMVVAKTFDCSAPVICGKPQTITDARNNTTNFTYYYTSGAAAGTLDATGLPKSELGPAAAQTLKDGSSVTARPLKLWTYVKRFAYQKDGSGSLVAFTDGVWVPETETVCQAASGSNSPVCSTSANAVKVVTTYEYSDTSSTAGKVNALLPRAKVVDSGTGKLNLRTCYGYDDWGNKLWETSPKGACS